MIIEEVLPLMAYPRKTIRLRSNIFINNKRWGRISDWCFNKEKFSIKEVIFVVYHQFEDSSLVYIFNEFRCKANLNKGEYNGQIKAPIQNNRNNCSYVFSRIMVT